VKPGKTLINPSSPFLPAPGSPAAHKAGSGSGGQITDGDKTSLLSAGLALSGGSDLPKVGNAPSDMRFPFILSPAAEHACGQYTGRAWDLRRAYPLLPKQAFLSF